MVKLIGWKKKLKTAVFISGKGSNLKNLIKFSKKKSPIQIKICVSNNKKLKVSFAKKFKIKKKLFKFEIKKILKKNFKIL